VGYKLLTDTWQYRRRKTQLHHVRFRLSNSLWNKFLDASYRMTRMVTYFPQCNRTDHAEKILERIQQILDYYDNDLEECMLEFKEGDHDVRPEKKNP
jgi:hypothetical protein